MRTKFIIIEIKTGHFKNIMPETFTAHSKALVFKNFNRFDSRCSLTYYLKQQLVLMIRGVP